MRAMTLANRDEVAMVESRDPRLAESLSERDGRGVDEAGQGGPPARGPAARGWHIGRRRITGWDSYTDL